MVPCVACTFLTTRDTCYHRVKAIIIKPYAAMQMLMPGDATTRRKRAPATRENRLKFSNSEKLQLLPNPIQRHIHWKKKKKVHIEKRASKLCIRKPAAKNCVEHFHWKSCLAQPDCQSTSNVNVPLTATVRLSVAGWGP